MIDTGAKKVVYVEREPGTVRGGGSRAWASRTASTIRCSRDSKPGDKVAAAGGFLIDAETRLNPAAAATYFGASGGPHRPAAVRSAKPRPPVAPSGTVQPRPSGQQHRAATPVRCQKARAGGATNGRGFLAAGRPGEHRPASRRPTGNWRWRSGLARSPERRWARWACRSRSPSAASRCFLCCQGCVGKAKRSPDETLEDSWRTAERVAA